jgi:hypothetical protein
VARKSKPVTEPIEGFEIVDGKYVCTYQFVGEGGTTPCGREYVRTGPAEHHRDSHAAYEEHAKRIDAEKQSVKGDAIRELIPDLQAGKIDVPRLVDNLNIVATAVDMLHDEIEKADLRVLQRKADAYDKIAERVYEIADGI